MYLAHDTPRIEADLPHNIIQTVGIEQVEANGVILKDGSKLEVDAIIMCTGYRYSFPFLSPECEVNITRGRVTPLYKHIVNAKYPTLCMMAVPFELCPFTLFYHQIKFIMAALDGSMQLPSESNMLSDIEADYQERMVYTHSDLYTHYMANRQWEYYADLAKQAGFEPMFSPVHRMIWERVYAVKEYDLLGYKNTKFKLLGQSSFREYEI